MTTTSHLRRAWAPPCTGPYATISLYGTGRITVRAGTGDAWLALNECLLAHDYETRKADTGAFNCRKITGGTGYSLHAYGIAADLNWTTNPYGRRLVTDMPPAMVDAIKRLRTRNGHPVFRWGGDYTGNKDAMHFEIVCDPADLATGIDPTTLPTARPTEPTTPIPTPDPEDDMYTDEDRKRDEDTAKKVDVLYEQIIGDKPKAGLNALRQLWREDAVDSDAAAKQTRPKV